MSGHFPPYIYTKRGTFYFSRRIPKDIQEHFNTPRIMCSLKTKAVSAASGLAQRLNENLKDECWQILRHNAENTLLRFLNEHAGPIVLYAFPSLSECKDIYLAQNGTRKKTFFQTTDRAINTVIQLSGDRPADRYSKHDATTLPEPSLGQRFSHCNFKANVFSGPFCHEFCVYPEWSRIDQPLYHSIFDITLLPKQQQSYHISSKSIGLRFGLGRRYSR